MNRLAEGKIESKDIVITRESKLDDFKNNPQYRVFDFGGGDANVELIENTVFHGYKFYIEIDFWENKIEQVMLSPIVENYDIPTFPTEEYEAKRYAISKAFLFHELGQPSTVKENSICYDFDWGDICSFLVREGKEPYVGGDICITYKE